MPGNSTSTLVASQSAKGFPVDRSALENLVREVSGIPSGSNLSRTLRCYSEPTLSRLSKLFASDGGNEYGSAAKVIAHLVHSEADEVIVSDALNFLPGNPELFNQIRSIRHYVEFEHLPVDEIVEGSPEFEKVMALIGLIEPTRAALGISDREPSLGSPLVGISLRNGDHLLVFRDERVIQTILDNPDKRDLIRSVIEDHGAVHHETIRDALKNGAALGAGTL